MLGVRSNVEYLEMAVAWFVSGSDPSNDPGCDPWHPWRKGIENPMLYFLNTNGLYATDTTQWTINASFFNVTSFGPVTDLFRGLSDLHVLISFHCDSSSPKSQKAKTNPGMFFSPNC